MSIEFLQVEKCCFYMPLATGAKFFGFLSLSGSILLLIFGCFDLGLIAMWSQHKEDITEELVVIGVDLTAQILQSCTALLLLLGVYQRKSKLIPYWLLTTPIVAVLEFTILRNVTLHFFHIRAFQWDWFILNTITVLDDIYGWVVVYSYYRSILTPEAGVV